MIKKHTGNITAIAVITVFVWYFYINIDDFKLLLSISFPILLLSIAATFGGLFMNGVFMKLSISLFEKYINLTESVRVSLISSAGNFFAPAGSGLGFRAVYLKKKFNLAYSDYITVTFCNYIIVFIISALVGMVSLLSIDDKLEKPGSVILAIFFTALFVASIITLFLRIKNKDFKNSNKPGWFTKIHDILVKISIGWQRLVRHKPTMIRLIVILIANLAFSIFNYFLIMKSLGINIPLESLVLFSVLGSLSTFINITPGNLGVKEAVYIIFSTVIGLSTPQILSIALIERIILFLVLFVLWISFGKDFYKTKPKNI